MAPFSSWFNLQLVVLVSFFLFFLLPSLLPLASLVCLLTPSTATILRGIFNRSRFFTSRLLLQLELDSERDSFSHGERNFESDTHSSYLDNARRLSLSNCPPIFHHNQGYPSKKLPSWKTFLAEEGKVSRQRVRGARSVRECEIEGFRASANAVSAPVSSARYRRRGRYRDANVHTHVRPNGEMEGRGEEKERRKENRMQIPSLSFVSSSSSTPIANALRRLFSWRLRGRETSPWPRPAEKKGGKSGEPSVEYKFEYRCPLNPIEGFGRSLSFHGRKGCDLNILREG